MEAAMIFPSTLKERMWRITWYSAPVPREKSIEPENNWPADNFEHEGKASKTCEKILNFIQEFLWNIRTIPNIRWADILSIIYSTILRNLKWFVRLPFSQSWKVYCHMVSLATVLNSAVDGTFCQAALQTKINIKEQLPKYLDGTIQLCILFHHILECKT